MLELQVLTIVAGFGAVVLAAVVSPTRGRLLTTAVAFVVALGYLGATGVMRSPAAATLIAAAAALVLVKPVAGKRVAPVLAGLAGAVFSAALAAQGSPRAFSIILVGVLLGAVALLKHRREEFAPLALREEALLIVAVLGMLLAVTPAVIDGWRSAVALRSIPLETPASSATAWVFVVVGVCVLLGAVFAGWRNRTR